MESNIESSINLIQEISQERAESVSLRVATLLEMWAPYKNIVSRVSREVIRAIDDEENWFIEK